MKDAILNLVSFVSYDLGQCLSLSLFLMASIVLRGTSQGFNRTFLILGLPDVFLMLRLGLWIFGEEDH